MLVSRIKGDGIDAAFIREHCSHDSTDLQYPFPFLMGFADINIMLKIIARDNEIKLTFSKLV